MIVVVGGHSRNIGKTAVVEGILRACPEFNWNAVKITQHGHGICAAAGNECDCASGDDHPYAVSEEAAPSLTDSGRFLAAGATRAFWLRTKQGELAEGMPALRKILAAGAHTIVESNSLLGLLRPDVYVCVLDYAVSDMKDSTRRFLDRADALVTIHADGRPAPWPGVPARWLESKPRFAVEPPRYSSPEFAAWLRARLV